MSEAMHYIVVCRSLHKTVRTVRVVGPFASSDEAITWAHHKRAERRDWQFMPDVLEPPEKGTCRIPDPASVPKLPQTIFNRENARV